MFGVRNLHLFLQILHADRIFGLALGGIMVFVNKKKNTSLDVRVIALKMLAALFGVFTVILFSGFHFENVFLYFAFYCTLLFIVSKIDIDIVTV
jgi:hypothetical protein